MSPTPYPFEDDIFQTDFAYLRWALEDLDGVVAYVLHVRSAAQLAPLAERLNDDTMICDFLEIKGCLPYFINLIVEQDLLITTCQPIPGVVVDRQRSPWKIPGETPCQVILTPPIILSCTQGLFKAQRLKTELELKQHLGPPTQRPRGVKI